MNYFTAELLGTFVLIVLVNGVASNVLLTNTKGNNSGWIVISTGCAFAVYVGVLIAGPYSGAHINPAVTIALYLVGKFPAYKVIPYIFAQLLGGFLGSLCVWLFYKDHYNKEKDKTKILASFATIPAERNYLSNLFSEIIATFILIIGVFYISNPIITNNDKVIEIGLGSIGALPVAIIVWAIGLSLGGTTGFAINPARDLPPRILHAILPIKNKGSSDWSYSWIPVLGPIIAAFLASGLYFLLQRF